MDLPQQLAELALANSQGLLNDDEYRILRQNLFEQHSNNALVPVEAPVHSVHNSSSQQVYSQPHRVRVVDKPTEIYASPKPSLRRKSSFSSSVTNLFKRRGSARPTVSFAADPSAAPPTKLGFIPRLQQKANQLFSSQRDDKRPASFPVNSPSIPHPSSLSDISHSHNLSNAPLRLTKRPSIPTFSSTQSVTPSTSDIFDDSNLYTSKDIRAAIIATEAEAQRLLDAFNALETSTSFRVAQQNARRLRAPTPEHITALIDGSDWRRYIPPQSPPLDRRRAPAVDLVTDNTSVNSLSSSIHTTLSRSKSITSLRNKQNFTSPLSTRFPVIASSPPPSILRKNSISSIASQSRHDFRSNSSLSRSTSNLPLSRLVEGDYEADVDPSTDTDSHSEVSEVQRRRDEVIGRYNARLEYLHARLKSAELHERLLRN